MRADEHGPLTARPAAGPSRERWLRERAAAAPRPLRIFFEAELGYSTWAASTGLGRRARRRAEARAAAARGRLAMVPAFAGDGRRRPAGLASLPPEAQRRLARRLTSATVALGALSLATSANLRTGGEGLVFERLAGGGHEQAEALASMSAVDAVAALKGLASDLTTPPATAPAASAAAVVAPPTAVAPAAAPAGASPAAAGPRVPDRRGALPVGKGMWIWLADHAEGGDASAIVARAQAVGLTHLIVRTASLREGFYAGPFLDRLLPLAHAANIRVYAWDFPWLHDVDGDVARAVQAITHTTPDGHRVDGYVADIELQSMGVNVTPHTGRHFGAALRRAVGPDYPLIACVPRPNPALTRYPMADVVSAFDAIAPMVYWLHGDPVAHRVGTLRDLFPYGKPILPVGQAYDAGAEGGPPGVPRREALIRFMQAGDALGATSVSWWSWQHANQEAWDAIRDAAEFRLPAGDPALYTHGQVMAYQTLLSSLGFPSPIDGRWGEATDQAVRAYQQAANLPVTGVIDEATRHILLTPFPPPVRPQP
ncbi:MAG: peptidoglycan-binding domain-containing protein [Acidimicrobiia bacterium]